MAIVSAEEYMLVWLSGHASQRLKTLLEEKHLYQRVDISPQETVQKFQSQFKNDIVRRDDFTKWSQQVLTNERFALSQQQLFTANKKYVLTLILLNASLYCRKCDRREAFAPIWYTDASNEMRKLVASGQVKQIAMSESFQTFLFVYQCQRCLGTPESFLVRRDGWILGLHGRSPIEGIELPPQLPKTESRYYRDAVVAFNSGKVLAALFYLRTFIEQFGRRVTGKFGKVTGDEIFDAYADTLPESLKEQMPSLREWYDKLSEALHSAKEDAGLFESAKTEIEKHFDIRRVFAISETTAAQPASSEAASDS